MKTWYPLTAYADVTCVSCWISHIPAKMRGWWICLPFRAICIVHYTARLDPCAWMGMGNWTRPGASSIQLLSLGRRSSTERGLKSASDTWRYQLCFSANWEIWSPEAIGTHGCVCGYVCLFRWERRTVRPTTELVFVCDVVKCGVCVPLCEVWGGAGPGSGGFVWTTELWCRPRTLPGTGGGGLQSSVPFSAE